MARFNKLKIGKSYKIATNARIVEFVLPQSLQEQYTYQPGQHLTLKRSFDNIEHRRSYSICQQTDKGLQVGIRAVEGGLFSSWVFDHLETDMEIDVMTPSGGFCLKKTINTSTSEVNDSQIFFAAGCGITPIIALIRQALIELPQGRVSLFYLNKTLASTMFLEELQDLKNTFIDNFEVHYLFTQEQQQVSWLNGRLDKKKINQLFTLQLMPEDNVNYYICGPLEMINDVKHALEANKVNSKNIHFESFNTHLVKSNAKNKTVKRNKQIDSINIKLHGKTSVVAWQDVDNILEAGLKANLDLPYACQAGVCGTCRCKLVAGEVDIEQNFALEDYDLKQNFILSCQSSPKNGSNIIVDFDV